MVVLYAMLLSLHMYDRRRLKRSKKTKDCNDQATTEQRYSHIYT